MTKSHEERLAAHLTTTGEYKGTTASVTELGEWTAATLTKDSTVKINVKVEGYDWTGRVKVDEYGNVLGCDLVDMLVNDEPLKCGAVENVLSTWGEKFDVASGEERECSEYEESMWAAEQNFEQDRDDKMTGDV